MCNKNPKKYGNFSKSPGTFEVMVTSLRARGTAHRRPPMPLIAGWSGFYMKWLDAEVKRFPLPCVANE